LRGIRARRDDRFRPSAIAAAGERFGDEALAAPADVIGTVDDRVSANSNAVCAADSAGRCGPAPERGAYVSL
jgi:hypothetical protein